MLGRVTSFSQSMFRFCSGKQRRRRQSHSTKDQKLARTTDLFVPDTTMEDEVMLGRETIMTVDTEFRATTAKFTERGDIIPLRADLGLAG